MLSPLEARVTELGILVARELIGVESDWEPHRCEEWRFAELQQVTGLRAPIYGAAAEGRRLAPPSYLVAQYVDTVSLGIPDAPIRFNGGNSCRWLQPVYAGDQLERSNRVVGVSVRSGARGPLVIYSLETAYRRIDSGLQVAVCGITAIRQYLPDTVDWPRPEADRSSAAREATEEALGLDACPTSRDLVRYAAATSDFYEAHYDLEFARSKGLPGVIVHGLMKLAWFATLAATVSPEGFVQEIAASYRRVDLVGRPVRIGGELEAAQNDGRQRLRLWARQQDGQVSTLGSAVVQPLDQWLEEASSREAPNGEKAAS